MAEREKGLGNWWYVLQVPSWLLPTVYCSRPTLACPAMTMILRFQPSYDSRKYIFQHFVDRDTPILSTLFETSRNIVQMRLLEEYELL